MNDPDVILALENLKCIGSEMRKKNLVPGDGKAVQRMLDMDRANVDAPDEQNLSTPLPNFTLPIKVEKGELPPGFNSPPAKVFSGHKRHTSETFQDGISSAKKGKKGNTPSRGRVGGSPKC